MKAFSQIQRQNQITPLCQEFIGQNPAKLLSPAKGRFNGQITYEAEFHL